MASGSEEGSGFPADDYESLIATTDVELLKRAWRNEKAAPEILHFQTALVQRSREQIQLMVCLKLQSLTFCLVSEKVNGNEKYKNYKSFFLVKILRFDLMKRNSLLEWIFLFLLFYFFVSYGPKFHIIIGDQTEPRAITN